MKGKGKEGRGVKGGADIGGEEGWRKESNVKEEEGGELKEEEGERKRRDISGEKGRRRRKDGKMLGREEEGGGKDGKEGEGMGCKEKKKR